MTKIGNISTEYLTQYIDRIERLEEEKASLASDIRDVFAEAKSNGFDTKVMREVLKLRKLEEAERDEREDLMYTYMRALDMIPPESE